MIKNEIGKIKTRKPFPLLSIIFSLMPIIANWNFWKIILLSWQKFAHFFVSFGKVTAKSPKKTRGGNTATYCYILSPYPLGKKLSLQLTQQ
jgi:hypothetical protein